MTPSACMNHGLLALGLAALFVATSARAQDPAAGASAPAAAQASTSVSAPDGWRGFYFGAGGAYSNVSVLVDQGECYDGCYWGDYYDYDEGDGDFGYTLHAGWRFHQYGALEVSYLDAGPIGWDQDLVYMPEFNDYYNNRIEYSAKVTEVAVLGILPFGDRFEVYAKLGAAFSEGESVQRLDQSFGDQVVTRSVSDNGTGMSAEVKEKLFTSFYSTKGQRGTGLGMLVTHKLVEEHGGRIEVETELGQGTTVSVWLPYRTENRTA